MRTLRNILNTPIICGVFFCIILIFLDFTIKYAVIHSSSAYLCNTGVALSIPLPGILLIALWLIFVVGFILYIYRQRTRPLHILLPPFLILAGAIGNGIDRILYGCVIDYIPFFSFSVFNFADALITIGAILLVWNLFHERDVPSH